MDSNHKFLKQVAKYLYAKHGRSIADLTFIFPGRRAGVFFQRYLQEELKMPLFSPSILTINQWVSSESGLKVPEKLNLLIRLFRLYKKQVNDSESLDDFIYRGELILNDFNDIDKYEVDHKQLFRNVLEIKEIDQLFGDYTEEQLKILAKFWEHLKVSNDTRYKSQFLDLWNKIPKLYSQFKSELLKENLAYEGLMYRQIVDSLYQGGDLFKGVRPVFIGFNALNGVEERLFSFMKTAKNALFFWDYDLYYMNWQVQEAGMFIRRNLKNFPMPDDFVFSNDNLRRDKEVELFAVSSALGQAAYVGEWMKKESNVDDLSFDNTAVVLCNEDLLLPVVDNLYGISQVNVTMGYSLIDTVAYGLVKELSMLYRNSRVKDGERLFYYRYLLSFLSHPLIASFADDEIKAFRERVTAENLIYISRSEFNSDFIAFALNLPDHILNFDRYFEALIGLLMNEMRSYDKNEIHLSGLMALNGIVIQLHNELGEDGLTLLSDTVYFSTILRYMENTRIPFEGEPLRGMQVMGFLETRCLDFDRVVLLSVNDEVLPGKGSFNSLIPYSLRRGFGLPVVEQKNAMHAYYFYRLIQRAQKVTFLYDSRTEGVNSGEVSRFVTQLLFERPFEIQKRDVLFGFNRSAMKPVVVSKNESMLRKLEQRFQKYFLSPTALNMWMDCKLQFYFKYIEGIKEEEEVTEEIDALLFGRIAHKALEYLYLPFVGGELSRELLEGILKNEAKMQKVLNRALDEEYYKNKSKKNELSGKNRLVFEMVHRYVKRIVANDKKRAPFVVKGVEMEAFSSVQFENNLGQWSVPFGGIIDRVDEKDGAIYIVDYKTGNSGDKLSNIESLFSDSQARNKAAFQTLMYCMAYGDTKGEMLNLIPAVYGLRKVFMANFSPLLKGPGGDVLRYQDVKDGYRNGLQQLVQEVFDPEIQFVQTKNEHKCVFCPYRDICMKNN